MATRTTTAGQPASYAQSVELNEPQNGVSSRRLKKREIDRRCQRQARERTKTRITYLEGLVEDFRRQDSSGQLAMLLKQLQEVQSERDVMAKTLKDIQKAMDTNKPLKPMMQEESEDKVDVHNATVAYTGPKLERHPSSISSVADDIPLLPRPEPTKLPERISPTRNFDLAVFAPASSLLLQSQDQLFAPEVVPLQPAGPSGSPVLVQAKSLKEPNPMPDNYAENWSTTPHSCACNGFHVRPPGGRSQWQGNYWRYANEVLSERFDWTDDVVPEADELCDDVPIRVLLEGWDAVARRAPLHPSWQVLRRIDETLFSMCRDVERLAILRAMHTLLQFHTESTSDRYAKLPPWYMRRPSQKIAHSYAIDYFAWPGIRERFIFSEHDYCGNDFWTLFTTSFKVLWPYEFRDCYTRDIETGLYKVSPTFDQRLADIKCWTMGPDIFRRFPELYSDFPTFNHIPQAPSSAEARILSQMEQRKLLTSAPSPKAVQSGRIIQREEEEQVKLPPVGSQYIPVERLQTHVVQPPKPQRQQQYHHQFQQRSPSHAQQQAVSNPHMYSMSDLNPQMALDAFAYGAISEADFATVYHAGIPTGFQT